MVLLLLAATAMVVGWAYAATLVKKNDMVDVTIARRKNAAAKVKDLYRKRDRELRRIRKDGGDDIEKRSRKVTKKYGKKIKDAEKSLEKANTKKPDIIDLMPVCGYAILREKLKIDSDNRFFRWLIAAFTRTGGKEDAMVRARYLLAATITWGYLGILIDLCVVSIFVSVGNDSAPMLGGVVMFMTVILCYIPFSNLRQESQYREDRIEAEFPEALSKLAMLVNSGMDVARAWQITAESNEGVLYEEMRVAVEMQNNNVSPIEAYETFMNNCNNKYTTKLATSIMQNLVKGNAEIGALFIQMSNESWQERKHNAKRLGEKAQSGLLIPTIMIFGGIMILICVPIFAGMAGTM